MALSYERFRVAEADLLVGFLVGQTWPYHAFESPTEEMVRANLADGYYDGASTRTFWIYEDGRRIGIVRLEDLDGGTPMFDLRLGADHRGRGVGGRALVWLTRYLFTEFAGISRIEGNTRQDNTAMRRAFLRAGYVKEAHYRQAWPGSGGTLHDSIGYGILRRDWLTGSRTPVRWDDEPGATNLCRSHTAPNSRGASYW